MSIGENLKRIRLEKNLTQEKLAKLVGVTTPMITQIERGTKVLSLPLASEIAKCLECTVADFLD